MRGRKALGCGKCPQLCSPGELECTYNTFGPLSNALRMWFYCLLLLWPEHANITDYVEYLFHILGYSVAV